MLCWWHPKTCFWHIKCRTTIIINTAELPWVQQLEMDAQRFHFAFVIADFPQSPNNEMHAQGFVSEILTETLLQIQPIVSVKSEHHLHMATFGQILWDRGLSWISACGDLVLQVTAFVCLAAKGSHGLICYCHCKNVSSGFPGQYDQHEAGEIVKLQGADKSECSWSEYDNLIRSIWNFFCVPCFVHFPGRLMVTKWRSLPIVSKIATCSRRKVISQCCKIYH